MSRGGGSTGGTGRSSDERPGGKTRRTGVRLFVAAYPPRALTALLQDRLREIDLPPHRMTPTEQVHLTLHFIGERPESELDEIVQSVERSAAGIAPSLITIRRLITLPERGSSRLVAAECSSSSPLLELHDRLVRRLAHEPRSRPRNRYLPHLTLCRFRAPARVQLGELASLEGLEPGQLDFPIQRITLMRSRLLPAGAVHEPVASFTL